MLSRIDEHAIEIDSSPERVWSTIENTLPRLMGGQRAALVARALGCRDLEAAARSPVTVGQTIPGFHVSEVRRSTVLALEGEHRFSRYRLTFHVDELGSERARLRAVTNAEFPGPHGKVYRALVIGTRGHVVAVRRMLRAVKQRAETHRR